MFVVNCNLQRLDGPVRGNGRIIDELETLYAGAGWNVIKLVWGSDWDALLRRDATGALARAFANTVDGQFQTFAANDGAFNRAHFFNQNPELAALVADWTDDAIDRLHRGGHDMVKIHAAYHRAARHRGQPTVILAQTKKGFGMGTAGQGKMTTHQQKKLDDEALLAFRDRFALPISDADCLALKFYRPAPDSAEIRHLQAPRGAGRPHSPPQHAVAAPARARGRAVGPLRAGGRRQEMSSTMAIVRMLTALLRTRPWARASCPSWRRSAHLRHGQPVPPDRHLFGAGPAVRAGGHRLGALLPRGARRPDPGGRHHRGRRDLVLDRRRHQLFGERPAHAAVLYLTRCLASSASAT